MIHNTPIECTCNTHAIEVANDEDGNVYLTNWYRGDGNKLGLKDRLFWAFKVLWSGYPAEHSIVLEPYRVRLLVKVLQDCLESVEFDSGIGFRKP